MFPDLNIPVERNSQPLVRTPKGNIAWSQNVCPCGVPLDKVWSAMRKTIRSGKTKDARWWAYQAFLMGPEAEKMLWQELEDAVFDDIDQVEHPEAIVVVKSYRASWDGSGGRSEPFRALILDTAVRYLSGLPKRANGVGFVLEVLYPTHTQKSPGPNLPDNTVDFHLKEGKAAGLGLAHYIEGQVYRPVTPAGHQWLWDVWETARWIFNRKFVLR